ncbi:MAG: hypothetical protein IT482_14075 [Gammaproteobacteria bacterium]|nr:hypothetical protein [Gammaproteobacteria bacterium]
MRKVKAGCVNARLVMGLLGMLLVAGCSFESIRLHERQRCAAMPQSQASQCYSRTRDTRSEYEAKRRQLEQSLKNPPEKVVDPRFEEWMP